MKKQMIFIFVLSLIGPLKAMERDLSIDHMSAREPISYAAIHGVIKQSLHKEMPTQQMSVPKKPINMLPKKVSMPQKPIIMPKKRVLVWHDESEIVAKKVRCGNFESDSDDDSKEENDEIAADKRMLAEALLGLSSSWNIQIPYTKSDNFSIYSNEKRLQNLEINTTTPKLCCNRLYDNIRSYQNHQYTCHGKGAEIVRCKICNAKIKRISLMRHNQGVHGDGKIMVLCTIDGCGAQVQKNSLAEHRRLVHGEGIVCPHCNEKIPKYSLKAHIKKCLC